MKRYIKSSNRYVLYDGQQLALNEGETKPQAIARFKTQRAQEEADALEAKRLAKEEAEVRRAERRRTPRYKDGTIVTKDGKYYRIFDGYYYEDDDSVMYDAEPCTPEGKFDMPDDPYDYRWSSFPCEIDQRDIQRKIK